MFKKTLVAAAMAGAFVGSAFAANVTLYGVVDEALFFQHNSVTNFDGVKTKSTSSFDMRSGQYAASRFGLKGSEELGNGYTVSFKLENGLNADDGTMQQSGRLFGREASLTVNGPFGALSAGRMGGLGSSAGTYDTVYGIAEAFDGSSKLAKPFITSDRYDNMLTYQTPKFAGVQATAQYSFKKDNKVNAGETATAPNYKEGTANADRYAAFALTAQYGDFQGVAAYEADIRSNADDNKTGNTFYLGGNYDFQVAKVYALAQYFNGVRSVQNHSADGFDVNNKPTTAKLNSVAGTQDGLKGYGLHLGTKVPVAGGTLVAGLYYQHAKSDDGVTVYGDTDGQATDTNAETKSHYYGFETRYAYPLSKRTLVYVGAGYGYNKVKVESNQGEDTYKSKVAGGYLGLNHAF